VRENAARVVLSLALVGALVAGVAGPSRGTGWATKTIDRTVRCSTLLDALGKRMLLVNSSPKSVVTNPQIGVSALGPETGANELLVDISYRGPRAGPPGVLIHRGLCRPNSARIPLSARGLSGPATRFYTSDKCVVDRQVLIRVRAVLADWKGWTVIPSSSDEPAKRDLDFAQGAPVEASLAIRTLPARKPLVFGSLDRKARARFFSANWPRCGHS
jgi:hypothetical protein